MIKDKLLELAASGWNMTSDTAVLETEGAIGPGVPMYLYVEMHTGSLTASSIQVQQSDDGSTWETVQTVSMVHDVAADGATQKTWPLPNLVGKQVKLVVTGTGTATGAAGLAMKL